MRASEIYQFRSRSCSPIDDAKARKLARTALPSQSRWSLMTAARCTIAGRPGAFNKAVKYKDAKKHLEKALGLIYATEDSKIQLCAVTGVKPLEQRQARMSLLRELGTILMSPSRPRNGTKKSYEYIPFETPPLKGYSYEAATRVFSSTDNSLLSIATGSTLSV
eukprot:gene23206-1419_t